MRDAVFGGLVIHQQSCSEEVVSPCSVLARGRRVLLEQPHRFSQHTPLTWPGRIFLTQQAQAAGAASRDNAEGNPFAQGQLWNGLGFWFFSKYLTRGGFSTLLVFHKCGSPRGSQRLLHAALCIMAGKGRQFQYTFPGSNDFTKAAFQG